MMLFKRFPLVPDEELKCIGKLNEVLRTDCRTPKPEEGVCRRMPAMSHCT